MSRRAGSRRDGDIYKGDGSARRRACEDAEDGEQIRKYRQLSRELFMREISSEIIRRRRCDAARLRIQFPVLSIGTRRDVTVPINHPANSTETSK